MKSKSRLYDLIRTRNEVNINDYNVAIALAWCGNQDIQYIGENSTALAQYLAKYQTKPEKSHIVNFAYDINSTKPLRTRLFNFGINSLSNRECGAMEAVDNLLGLSLYATDYNTTFKWIDVNMCRSKKVKSKKEAESLPPDDVNIYCPNLVDTHYPLRPCELEDTCLYDFARNFDLVKTEPKKETAEFYPFPNFGFLRLRKIPHLINHRHFTASQNPEQHFFSLLLLFKPWRQMSDLLENHENFTCAFAACKDTYFKSSCRVS